MSSETEIHPFRVGMPDDAITDLRRRITATRRPSRELVADRSQGVQLATIQELSRYWATDYDWRACEAKLNALPQFKTEIDGVDIHFIHVKSRHGNALPMIITHGWPGSVIELLGVVGPLTDPTANGGSAQDAFDLVLPSLPGYGFSAAPTEVGWDPGRVARAWAELMGRLGYPRYGAQGGDWGSLVSAALGRRHPARVLGVHLNFVVAFPDPGTIADLTEREQAALASMKYYGDWDSGYSKQQSTRPQTIGYGLVDSPAGLCAWIVEKFWSWTDSDGDPASVLTRDELLDNVMMYWLPATGASSARMYWESFAKPLLGPVEIPVGCSIFPKEIFRPSRRWAEKQFADLRYFNELEKGGHFAAFEQPEAFVAEVRAAFSSFR